MTEFAIFALVVISAGFCFWPFFRRQPIEALSTRDTPLGRVQQRKDTLLQNIADLDFEYNMGKLSEGDYGALRGSLKSQAAEALEQIDLIEETESMLGHKTPPPPKSPRPGRAGPAAIDASCSECGAALTPAARFCSSCGHKLG